MTMNCLILYNNMSYINVRILGYVISVFVISVLFLLITPKLTVLIALRTF